MISAKALTSSISKPLRLFSATSARLCSSSEISNDSKPAPAVGRLSEERKRVVRRREYRFAYPEFLPDCEKRFRNHTRELLERRDMLARRETVMIPEFYVGSIVAVTTSKSPGQGPDKESHFVGIVIDRGGTGLRSWIVVRNVINEVGVEFMFDLYSPHLKDVEVLRLEKRLDDELYYLRDCDPKYSTVPVDMLAELLPEDQPAPVNDVVVPLGPRPWYRNWQRFTDRLFGYTYEKDLLTYQLQKKLDNFNSYLNFGWQLQQYKYDLMREYFLTIPLEEQDAIWAQVAPDLERRDAMIKRNAAKKALAASAQNTY